MLTRLCVSALLVGCLWTGAFADTVALQKDPEQVSGLIKMYNISAQEQITLYGANHRHWMTETWFWGEYGFGALGGKRSGYLEGGLTVGGRWPVAKDWSLEALILGGPAGGGAAPQGGGLLASALVGLDYQWTPQASLTVRGGYLKFLNGDIQSPVFEAGINWDYWVLGAKSADVHPAIPTIDVTRLQARKVRQEILYETYVNSEDGMASVLGFQWDTYVNSNWFIPFAICGAVGGHRGGYGTASVGIGVMQPLGDWGELDIRQLIGSGGGGGVAAGGGLALETTLSWRHELVQNGYLELKVGALTFPSGTFNTPTFTLGFSTLGQSVFLPYP